MFLRSPELAIPYLQSQFYSVKRRELEAEKQELNRKLERYAFNAKMDELTQKSLRLFRAELATRYHWRNNRQCFEKNDFRRNSVEFTREYPVVLSTTYSIKGTLSIEHIYDYLIVDEASQVDLATGVLALSCARNIVIVGDLKQLPNVLTEDDIRTSDAIWQKYSLDERYRFSTHSLLSSALEIWQDAPATLLREHYRCHPKIINFCNRKFYHGQLIVMTKDHDEPDVLTMYRTTAGNHARGHINQRQIDVIQREVLPRLHQQNFQSIGIITPYTQKKGYTDIKALVAFSGKVKLPDDDTEYSEASMNGFPGDRLTKEFDKDDYQVLLVANKYQTGFDQPKLCAMYVLKKLKGVSAVQTLSRLNRICPPFEKKTFVLDFVNTYEDIKAAFAPYYTTTLLSTSVTPTAIYDLEAQIDAYTVLDPDDIEKANELLYKGNISSKDKQKLTFYFKRAKNRIEQYELIKQHEIVSMMRHFVRFYEFLLQVSCFEDTDLHKKYNFITYLLAYINIKHPGGGYNLDGKIKATNFVQKKSEEHTTPNLVAQPVVKLPTAESFGLTEAKEERLSQIIAEINSRTGKAYDNDVAVKAMLQIRDILLKSDKLKTSARNNTVKDFEFSYFDDIDDALIEGLEQNQDFFSLLLSNDEIKRQVLGIFTDEIYKSLREA